MKIADLIPGVVRSRWIAGLVVVSGIYVVLRVTGVHDFFQADGEGIGVLLTVIGTLYSVLYAFATYVIWGQFTAVENQILQESGSLKDLLVFSRPLPEKMRDPLVRAVRNYSKNVVEREWEALSRNENVDQSDKLFLDVVCAVTEVKPEDESQKLILEQLIEIASQASMHRDERIAHSVKRMPHTLHAFVSLTACMILLLLLLYPFHSTAIGLIAIAIAGTLLFFARFILMDLDNPFEGTWNADNEPFMDLVTKFR